MQPDARSAIPRLRERLDDEQPDPRCPRCGVGDLLRTRVFRGVAPPIDLEFCVGIFDRGRRRFVRRSCGYTGSLEGEGAHEARTEDA